MGQRACGLVNLMARAGYRGAYLALRAWWFVRRPQTRGVAVALWHEGKVLLVRTSYRDCYSLPGGFVSPGELPEHAAHRELREELGIELPAEALCHAWRDTLQFESRRDTIDIWEAAMDSPPDIHITGREIVWAGWMDPSAAQGRRLLPHVAAYLAQR